jgi:hypothetical protein
MRGLLAIAVVWVFMATAVCAFADPAAELPDGPATAEPVPPPAAGGVVRAAARWRPDVGVRRKVRSRPLGRTHRRHTSDIHLATRGWGHWAPRVAHCESRGRYDARNPRSSATGRYQAIRGTWGGYGGYPEAAAAPPHVQERHAAELFTRAGLRPWRASRRCWSRR